MKAKGATKSSEIVVDVQDPAAPIFEAARLIENSHDKGRVITCFREVFSSGWIERHKLVGRNPSYRTADSQLASHQRRSHGKRRPRTGITASSENSARAKLETRQLVRLLAGGILARWK